MRKVVVNSTPLIALCKVGKLELLKLCYQEIIIPQAVYSEICAKNDAVEKQIRNNLSWIHIVSVQSDSDKKMYKAKLHAGEVEVMILAQEIDADLVIIDDGPARKTAEYLGLKLTGTIGTLIMAKQNGDLNAVMPVIDAIKENGFHIEYKLESMVRRLAGE